jgi:hypothetical protein
MRAWPEEKFFVMWIDQRTPILPLFSAGWFVKKNCLFVRHDEFFLTGNKKADESQQNKWLNRILHYSNKK